MRKREVAPIATGLLMVLTIALGCGPSLAAQPSGVTYTFDIPPQKLNDALQALAFTSQHKLVYASKLVDGRDSSGLKGEFTTEEAVEKLLTGTGLMYQVTADGMVVIRARSTATSSVASAGASQRLAQAKPMADEAQDTHSAAASEPSGNKVEEIIVSARKVNERLQDVPATVSAVTGEQLRAIGAVDMKDVLRSVPGVSFSGQTRGLSRYTIRGISTSAVQPTVGVFIDDISLVTVAQTFTGALDPILFDMERVEILKGPQGTLYGGNAMGGAIKYVSAHPDATAISSDVGMGLATTAHGAESYNAQAVLNLPLIQDVLAVRGGIYYNHEGGFVDNVAGLNIEDSAYSSTASPTYTPVVKPSLSRQSREDFNFADTYVGRLSLLWQPDPTWSIRPTATFQKTTLENPNYILPGQGLVYSARFAEQPQPDRAGIYSLEIVKKAGPVEITWLSGYFDRVMRQNRDYSFVVGSLRVNGANNVYYPNDSFINTNFHDWVLSHELRVASSPDSDSRLSWVGGLYYNNQQEWDRRYISTYGFGFANNLSNWVDTYSEARQRAVFGEVTYHMTDAFDITAGLRAFDISSASNGTTFIPLIAVAPLAPPAAIISQGSIEDQDVNPKVGLSYQFNREHLVYANAAKGFRPGGFIAPLTNALCLPDVQRLGYASLAEFPSQYESDNLWTYELGTKNEFGAGRLMLNAAVFYSDWDGIQQSIALTGCGARVNLNAGKARVEGAELETRINVTPSTQLGLTATMADAKILTASSGSTAHDGDQVLDTPKWTGSVYATQSVVLNAAWDLMLRADYQYRDEQRRFFELTQSFRFPNGTAGTTPFPANFQEGYEIVNASATLNHGATNIRLYINNVLDEAPILDYSPLVGITQAMTLRPRTFGVDVRRQF